MATNPSSTLRRATEFFTKTGDRLVSFMVPKVTAAACTGKFTQTCGCGDYGPNYVWWYRDCTYKCDGSYTCDVCYYSSVNC
jgi:hypothetical protein